MPATCEFEISDQFGTPVNIGGSGAVIRMTQHHDNAVEPSVSPIPQGQASIERLWRGKFTGTYSNILNVKTWRSDANTLATGVVIRCGGLGSGGVAFATPSTTPNADANIPTTEPGSSNVTVDGSGATRYAPALSGGNNRWVRLQIGTAVNTPGGSISPGDPHAQLTLKYEEN